MEVFIGFGLRLVDALQPILEFLGLLLEGEQVDRPCCAMQLETPLRKLLVTDQMVPIRIQAVKQSPSVDCTNLSSALTSSSSRSVVVVVGKVEPVCFF